MFYFVIDLVFYNKDITSGSLLEDLESTNFKQENLDSEFDIVKSEFQVCKFFKPYWIKALCNALHLFPYDLEDSFRIAFDLIETEGDRVFFNEILFSVHIHDLLLFPFHLLLNSPFSLHRIYLH